ncbi:MAG: 6-hydroxymethylpterin diphosphokinase MptE-like protein, partial [Rectinemataceae bacterium]
MSLLETNLAALRGRFPELAALVESAPVEPEFELVLAASGERSARIPGGAWLHSSRDPRAEARRLVAASLGGADTAVLLGLGLGYLAEAVTEAMDSGAVNGGVKTRIERILACEADPGALKAAFRARDLSALLADERLGFVVGGEPEGLISALELSGGSKAVILELKAATSAYPSWFERSRRAAERWNAKGAVNENTLRRFGRLWVRNLARNLGAAVELPGVERLGDLFAGAVSAPPGATAPPIPALILAAGPSLDLVLPYIKDISRRALVVCVDTALRSLLRFGVEPDFLVVVDPQYWNWRHLSGLSSPSSFLVSEMAAWPAVFRAPRRASFLGGSVFPLGRRIEAFAGRKGQLGAGGSVATSAWDLCRIMGCSPLWMAGLDLAYPGGQTHAKASLFEQRALASGNRLAPAASAQAAVLVGGAAAGAQSFEAPSMDGGKVRTDQRLTLYAWWFESRFARPLSPPTLSLSPCGLGVPGLALGSVEELLSCPDRRGEIDGRLDRAAAISPNAAFRDGVA